MTLFHQKILQMNKSYKRGRVKEWEAKNLLEERGYKCSRAAGSHGSWDVLATKGKMIWWIQLKRFKKATTAQKNAVVKEAFKKMKDLPNEPYAIPVVLLWVDHQGWEDYYVDFEWNIMLRKDCLPDGVLLDIA